MYVTENIRLINELLKQLSADSAIDSIELTGNQDLVLFGLREMMRLRLITGVPHYSDRSDPTGPLFSSVSAIRLTKRGIALKGR
jgi:hypothetical protein